MSSLRFFVISLILFCLQTPNVHGQRKVQKPKSSTYYLNTLKTSKDALYAKILLEFDDYLENNPKDIDARIEKCIVINQAYYDEYEGYSPNYDEFEVCLQELVHDFPENQTVLLYKLDYVYGDSLIEHCNRIIHKNLQTSNEWSDENLAIVYKKLAYQYSYNDRPKEVIKNARLAENLSDSLDLSLLLSQQYYALKNYDLAKTQLTRSLDSLDESWESIDKGNLLLKLGEPDKALQAFEFAQNDTAAWMDNTVVAQALIENGKPEEARAFFLKDLKTSYSASATLHQLFVYDYYHSPADTILTTYNRLNAESFLNDAFGKYRLMMLLKSPLSGWHMTDLAKFLILIMMVVLILAFPYLWILPLHYLSTHFKWGEPTPSLQNSRWGLRDFWIVCSAVLLLEFFTGVVFNYVELVSSFLDDLYLDEENNISYNKANTGLFYFVGMLILVLSFIRKNDYKFLKAVNWSSTKGILTGVGLAILLRAIYFSAANAGLLPSIQSAVIGSVQDYFASINTYYHSLLSFLFIVILIPFYEEYLFRGIAMIAMEKRTKFVAANVIQSTVFSLLHGNLSLFLFYFAFGMIAGLMVRKSGSITPSIIFHMTNNLLAFIALSRLS